MYMLEQILIVLRSTMEFFYLVQKDSKLKFFLFSPLNSSGDNPKEQWH